ncbi:MAG: radical SAM protein, partial [Oscillospiraceae bacterium]
MLGVYIHIPFCVSKCNYCDFYSLGRKTAVPDEYVNAIIAQYQKFKQNGEITASPDTIYFGGGTPSLLTAKQIDSILTEICGDNTLEITLEANPKTVTENSLRDFRQVGINRLSVGVQSANDETLKILGRGHT